MNQENQPTANQLNSNPVIQTKPKSSYVVVLLSSLLLISCIIAGFFAYQTQNLVKELQEVRNEKLVVLTPTPQSTHEPGLEPEPVPLEILTKDWKTYINTLANYQISYPKEWKPINIGSMNSDPATPKTRQLSLMYQPDISESAKELTIEVSPVVNISQDIKFDENKKIGQLESICGYTNNRQIVFCWLKIPNSSDFLIFVINSYKESSINIIIDQILSTFKFTK